MAPLPLALIAATLAAGTPALDDDRSDRGGAHRLAEARRPADGGLVLPLTIPVLIFGVAAASAASGGAAPFLTPVPMLCALSLAHRTAPFAAAARRAE